MKEILVEELKQIQLDILDDVSAFCELHQIKYFLAYGTLIGAIRHNGYIPWDDDIDIAMPRPDYDRFLSTYCSKSGRFEVICHEKNSEYGLPFAKVHHNGTMMVEGFYHQDNYGVYIDVFPIDAYVDKMQLHKAQSLRRLLNAKKATHVNKRPFIKDFAIRMTKLLYYSRTIPDILNQIDALCKKGDYNNAEKVGYIPSLNIGMKDIISKEYIESYEYHIFEGKQYRIPAGYDLYLRQLYGDYMDLPPIEKRFSHHSFEAWWK